MGRSKRLDVSVCFISSSRNSMSFCNRTIMLDICKTHSLEQCHVRVKQKALIWAFAFQNRETVSLRGLVLLLGHS